MKLSDVFILVGACILLGAFFMHAWAPPPVELDAVEGQDTIASHTSGASLLKGDSMEFVIEATNASDVSLEVADENDLVVSEYSNLFAAGDKETHLFEATTGGFYTYTVTFTEGQGSVMVDVDRQLFLDFMLYPIGALLLAFGIVKRKENLDEGVIDAVLEVEISD